MGIDATLLGLLAVFGAFGWRSGAATQLTHWVGLGAAYGFAKPLAGRAAPWLASHVHLSAAILKPCLATLLFSTLYVIGSHLVWTVFRKLLGEEPGRSRINAFGGSVLGGAKGAMILYVLLSLAVFFEAPIEKETGLPREAVEGSRVVTLVRAHNLFKEARFPALARIGKLLQAARDPSAAQALANDPRLKALAGDPKLQAVLRDPRLADALRTGNLEELREDPHIRALLEDKRLGDETAAALGDGRN